MVGPVVSIGTPGTSQFRVDYGPRQRDQALALHGIDRIFGGIKDFADRRNTATLTEMLTAKADHDELVDFAGKRGLLPQLGEMLTARRALAPPPMPETFENVHSPYGRGGDAQRSTTTGRIVGYQPPGAAPKPGAATNYYNPATRETKAVRAGSDAETALLGSGGWLKGDLPDKPSTDRPPIQNVISLSNAWQKATGPLRSIMRQRDLMQIGLERAAAGDMAAGSQAVLVTFQKILDPTSVVRESEYARSASGLSLVEQAKGQFEKFKQGGAGMTLEQLASFARFADEAVAKLAEGRVGKERARIKRFADAYGIDPALIFEGRLGAPPPAAAPAPAGGVEAVMQSLGLGGPGFDPQTRPPPAQASTMDPRFMGDAGLVSGAPPTGPARFATMGLSGLRAEAANAATMSPEDYAAYQARLRAIAEGR